MPGKNMILINSVDFQGVARSFKMIPITQDCPYVECIFSVNDKILAVITKIMKQSYHFVPKLDDNGDAVYVKNKNTRPNGKQVKEERRLVDTFSEFYIITPEEIKGFIESFAVNAKEFDYESIIDGAMEEEDPNKKLFVPEKPAIVKEMPKA